MAKLIEKSTYREIRENDLKLSREDASFLLEGISAERLEKLENGKIVVRPEDIISMADGYNRPELCNYYCLHECAIGKRNARSVKIQDLTHIAVDTINALNQVEKLKERFLEIVEDDQISEDEYRDFEHIRGYLERIASTADSLRVWIDKTQKYQQK